MQIKQAAAAAEKAQGERREKGQFQMLTRLTTMTARYIRKHLQIS